MMLLAKHLTLCRGYGSQLYFCILKVKVKKQIKILQKELFQEQKQEPKQEEVVSVFEYLETY